MSYEQEKEKIEFELAELKGERKYDLRFGKVQKMRAELEEKFRSTLSGQLKSLKDPSARDFLLKWAPVVFIGRGEYQWGEEAQILNDYMVGLAHQKTNLRLSGLTPYGFFMIQPDLISKTPGFKLGVASYESERSPYGINVEWSISPFASFFGEY